MLIIEEMIPWRSGKVFDFKSGGHGFDPSTLQRSSWAFGDREAYQFEQLFMKMTNNIKPED